MTTEPESTRSAASTAFKRTELQRFSSPIPGFEIVQTLAEIPMGSPPAGTAIQGDPKSGTSCGGT